MTNIFYFARYSQPENFATNNTLLLLHRLHEQSRRRFQEFLSILLDEKADAPIAALGLQIVQQEPSGKSVLDGFLYQSAVRIGIEAKSPRAPFNKHQILNHLGRFEENGSGYMLLLGPDKVDLADQYWKDVHEHASEKRVIVSSITFQQIIDSFRECLRPHDDEMHDLIDDFESFCSGQNLLGTDRTTLFVPPCGQSFEINVKQALYFCPSNWSRRNVQYLGIYRNKTVQYIGQIDKVAHCDLDKAGNIVPIGEISLNTSEIARISGAIHDAKAANGWDISTGHQFFLCSELVQTSFKKSTRGGIMGHRYIDLQPQLPKIREMPLANIAAGLTHLTWS